MILLYLTLLNFAFLNVHSNSIEKIDYTLNLIKQGDSIIKFGEHENIILLLGNTGGGKSTLAQLLAGDNDQLISKEIGIETGEYVIEDKDNKISQNSTLISQTIFPELVFDSLTNSAYYDCPGFSDTRNSSIDIASTYFIRKVITSAKSLKSIFVVNYSSVKEGVDRNDFLQLLKHAGTLYKNFDGFKEGLALVVTKVDNVYVKKHGKLVLVADEKIIANIADFLNKAKVSLTDLIKEETDNTKKEVYLNAIKLVDILLTTDNNGLNKIGIFRRPDQAGPLSKIPLIQEGKKSLQNLIQNRVQYIAQQEQNFGYTISEESKSDIDELIQQINQNIMVQVTEISKNVKSYFIEKENVFTNLIDLKTILQTSNVAVLNMIKTIESITTPKQLYQAILSVRDTLQLPLEETYLLNIIQYDNFLDFIKIINSKNLDLKPNEVIQAFESATRHLTDSINLYTFLIDFHIKLHEWSIQKDTSKFNVVNFKSNLASLKNQNVVITGENIKPFLDEIFYEEIQNGYSIRGFDSIKTAEINTPKINVLLEIIDLAMDPNIELICENSNKLVVKGNVVKISQVLNSAICPEKLQQIKIFALNKIFFDQDLQQIGRGIKVLMASEVWEIIDLKQLNLIGENGASFSKAPNGVDSALEGAPGENGVDGRAGLRGQSGGAFFGIVSRAINCQNFVIKSVGGDGSQGQEGGNGGNGGIGKDVDWQVVKTFSKRLVDTYQQKGTVGGVGGNGGNGARGGFPGPSGEIQIIQLAENLAINIQQQNGQYGADSFGGIAGSGGLSGNQCTSLKIGHEFRHIKCNRIKSNNGVNGKPGINTAGLEPPVSSLVVDRKDNFINNYKNYIKLHLNNRIRINSMVNLINILNNSPTINEIK